MNNDTQEAKKSNQFLENFLPQLKNFVQSETVFGKPYTIEGATLIPVNSVKVGFGFGDTGLKKVTGEGGGGGVLLSPVALIVIKDGNTSIHNLNGGMIENVIEKVPDLLEKLTTVFQKIKNQPSPQNSD